jgi:Putative transposase
VRLFYRIENYTFTYRDRASKSYCNFTTSVDEFIGRFIQHIPDGGFRMIRFYGALANRVRGKLLPIIFELLGQKKIVQDALPKITFPSLMKSRQMGAL